MRGAALGLLPPGVERVAHARAARLDGEIDNGGRAAEGRGARAGFEIVGRGGAAERHVEVRVGVDAAGDHVHAGGVDDAGGVLRDAGTDLFDTAVFDEHIRPRGIPRRHHRAIANQSVCHGLRGRFHLVSHCRGSCGRGGLTPCRPEGLLYLASWQIVEQAFSPAAQMAKLQCRLIGLRCLFIPQRADRVHP